MTAPPLSDRDCGGEQTTADALADRMTDQHPHTGQSDAALREALEHMVRGVESLLSSLPFSAPENIGFLVNAKLGEPAQDARDALGWDLEDA